MATSTYSVTGMTCGHCVSSVKEEISAIPGVTSVDVELSTGLVTIDSVGPLDNDAVRAAVKEAGYQLDESARTAHSPSGHPDEASQSAGRPNLMIQDGCGCGDDHH